MPLRFLHGGIAGDHQSWHNDPRSEKCGAVTASVSPSCRRGVWFNWGNRWTWDIKTSRKRSTLEFSDVAVLRTHILLLRHGIANTQNWLLMVSTWKRLAQMRITIPFDEDAKVYLILMFKTIQGTPIYPWAAWWNPNFSAKKSPLFSWWNPQFLVPAMVPHLRRKLWSPPLPPWWRFFWLGDIQQWLFWTPTCFKGLTISGIFGVEKNQRGEEMLQNCMLHYKITLHHCVRTPAACHIGATVQHPPNCSACSFR